MPAPLPIRTDHDALRRPVRSYVHGGPSDGTALIARGDDAPSATGHFVHVFVDRETRRPTPIPERLREALARVAVGQ